MFESIFATTTTSTSATLSIAQVILSILIAFLTGSIISLTYIKTHPKGNHSQNFALTIVLLPAVVAIIIMLIGSDVARAFSLAGAFSIIRFRSAPGEPKDIAYVLFAMAAGLSTGVGVFGYALLFTAVLCAVMYALSKTDFGSRKRVTKELRITVPEDLDYEAAFEEVFQQYTVNHNLVVVKTSALGSLYQLTYEVELAHEKSIKTFMDDLRCRNGNLNITLSLAKEEPAY